MLSSRFLRLFLFVVVLLSVVAAQEEFGVGEQVASESECAEGECANPEVDEAVAEAKLETIPEGVVEDPNCPSRGLVIRCAGKHLDTNGNGKLDRAELEIAINTLPWYARGEMPFCSLDVKRRAYFSRHDMPNLSPSFVSLGILNILGSVDKMMKKCDLDGDGAIGMTYDMENNHETCLATCFKRKAFKSAFFPDCQ
jgi:hypothetical protein